MLAAAAVTLLWLVVVTLWHDAPFGLTFDDAFYYFGIARNVAHGHGSTFDGINLTNGYHPLWMLLSVPVFASGLDGTEAVRVLLLFQVLCYGAALALIARTVGRAIDGWTRVRSKRVDDAGRSASWCTGIVAAALVVLTVNPFVVKVFVNGMESGVLVLLDAALLAIGATWNGRLLSAGSGRTRWLTGLLLAAIVLARTDSVLLLAVLGVWALAEARSSWTRSIRPLVQLFALPGATLVAYLLSNQLWFGTAVQISGLTKRADLTPTRAGWFAVALVAAGGVAVWGFRRSTSGRRQARFGRVTEFSAHTAWFAAFCLLVVAYYQVFQTQQWLWYYCPVAIYLIMLLLLGVADFVEAAVLEAPAGRRPSRALLPVSAILLLPLLAAVVFETRAFTDPHSYSLALADRDAGQWIDRHVPPHGVLASWDAGVIGYYAHRPVMNLDGVANSYEYYQASRDGTVGDFLRRRDLTGIVNVGTPVDGQDPQITAFARDVIGEPLSGRIRVTRTWPFTYSGTTTGSAGDQSGTRRLAVFLYEAP
jgi:hypothetical protein